MLKLYDHPASGNCYKVRLLLARLGLSFRRVPVDLLGGGTRTPEFLALNPAGQIPVLVDDAGTAMCESNAILWRLGQGSDLVPADGPRAGRVLEWLFFEQSRIEPNLGTLRFWLRFRPDVAAARPGEVETRRKAGRAALRTLERGLVGTPFAAGEDCTVADLALYGYVGVAEEAGLPLDAFPAVEAWRGRMRALPGHVDMDDPVGPEAEGGA